jgi:hypothetical protein
VACELFRPALAVDEDADTDDTGLLPILSEASGAQKLEARVMLSNLLEVAVTTTETDDVEVVL